MNISKSLASKLRLLGASVIMTRDGDYDLGTPNAFMRKKSDFDHRIKIINSSDATYYISIHLNYLDDSSYFGPQVFYSSLDDLSLAQHFQQVLNSSLNGDRQVKKIPNSIYMYSKLKVKGILVECGFLSNASERQLLLSKDYIDKLSSVLVQGFLSC